MSTLTPGLILGLSLLGGLGAATRFVADSAINRWWPHEFPLATLIINVSGSLLIGLLAATVGTSSPQGFALAATGFCGGYTTFSTALVEAVRLAREGAWRRAALAALGTLVLCVGAAGVGVLLGRWLVAAG